MSILLFSFYMSLTQLGSGTEQLNARLPPIEFVFVNCAQSEQTFNDALTAPGVEEAIQAGRLLKEFRRPYIVCGQSTAYKETTKFMAEEMALENRPCLYQESLSPKYGQYTEIRTNPLLDTTDTDEGLTDKMMALIKDGYSHESTLLMVSNKHIFDILQRELTDDNIDIQYGDVCIFTPLSNKKWKINYRPNAQTGKV